MQTTSALILASTFAALGFINKAYAGDINDMIQACNNNGDSLAICQCAASKWFAELKPSDKQNAAILIESLRTDTTPPADKIQQLMPLMERFQQIGMQCAMNEEDEPEGNDGDN